MEYVVAALLFVLGACVGSFLNVLILRFGYTERGGERSSCMACGSVLGAFDLVPMFSYAALGGRCRTCGSSISVQYPVVEVLTGLLFLLTYLHISPLDSAGELYFISFAGFWAAMVALVAYDVRHTLIPIPFVLGLYAFAAIRVAVESVTSMSLVPTTDALLGALVCGGFFAVIHAATRGRGMGIGDAYVAGAIGLLLGLEVGIVASVLAVWSGSLIGLSLILSEYVFQRMRGVAHKTRVTLTTEIPFAPFLALGALLAWSLGIKLVTLGISLNFS